MCSWVLFFDAEYANMATQDNFTRREYKQFNMGRPMLNKRSQQFPRRVWATKQAALLIFI